MPSALDRSVSLKYIKRVFIFPHTTFTPDGTEQELLLLNVAFVAALGKYPHLTAHINENLELWIPHEIQNEAVCEPLPATCPTYNEISESNAEYDMIAANFVPQIVGRVVESLAPDLEGPCLPAAHLSVYFIKGGLVLSFAMLHWFVDGASFFLFLQEFAYYRRRLNAPNKPQNLFALGSKFSNFLSLGQFFERTRWDISLGLPCLSLYLHRSILI